MAMDVISGGSSSSSTLNPNAPMFVPLAYRTVEDFSDEWWALVQSSPWFRDYWIRERYCDLQTDPSFLDNYDPALAEIDLLFADNDEEFFSMKTEEEEERDYSKELVCLGALKWRKGHDLAKAPRYADKVPKIVKVKPSPRTIQQPR